MPWILRLVVLPCPMGALEAISGKTQHLDLQWGEACGRACFIVIVGLESPPCLIRMDIMKPLRVRIDVTNGTATPAQQILRPYT